MKIKRTIITMAALAVVAGFAATTFADEEKEETISMDKVPQAVKQTLAKYAAESEVKNVEKGNQDGKLVYEFDIQQGSHKFEVAISKKGKYMGTEEDVAFKDLPEAVQKTLNEQANGGKISGCEKAVDAKNKVSYEADIEKDGKKFELAVDADGKVINKDSESKEKSDEKEGKEKN